MNTNKKKIFLFTIGYNCDITLYVKNYLGINKYNSPFDWNIVDNISKIETLFENNFQNYVYKELYHSPDFIKENNYTDKNHITNHNREYEIRFMHDYISKKDDFYYYDTDLIIDKYNRRIERTFEYINEAEKIIILHNQENVSYNYPNFIFEKTMSELDKENKKIKLDNLIIYLKNKYNNKKFEYLLLDSNETFTQNTKYLLNEILNNNNILLNGNITERTLEISKELNI